MNQNKRLSFTGPDGKSLYLRRLTVDDLDAAYALCREQLQSGMAARAVAGAVIMHNSDSCWGVYEAGDRGEVLLGFLSFLMLNEKGADLLKLGQFDVLNPDIQHLAPTGERPAVIYVWLIVARGLAGVAVPLTMFAMGPLYTGLPLYGTAATEAGARGFRNFGYQPVHRDRPDIGNLFMLDRSHQAPDVPFKDKAQPPTLKVAVAHSSLEVEHARAIRAAVYMAEQDCPFAEEFDGNDHTATHMVGYVDGEPAATLRIRYFGTFVKIERLAVLRRFRGASIADQLVLAAIEFCRRKGFQKAYGHPQLRLVPFWGRYGFHAIEGIAPFRFSDHEYIAVEGPLAEHPDAIGSHSDPYIIMRPEGLWDEPGILERSGMRSATNPHVEGS